MSSSSHQFQEKTFTKLTYCDYCTKLLWGVAKQGVTCEGCHYNCHKKCSELVYNNCIRSMYIPSGDDFSGLKASASSITSSSTPKSTLSPRRANTEGMRVSIPPAIVSSSQPLQSLVERSPATTKKKDQDKDQDKDKDSTPPAVGRTKFLEDAIISAAIRMSLPGDISALPKNDHPALSIQATTINFTRFVHKTTGLFWFQDRIEDILTWKDPWNSVFVLVLYCFVCIYPLLLFLLPQCIMATIMIYFFQQKSARQQQKILGLKNQSNHTVPQQQQQQQQQQQISAEEAYIAAQEKAHHNRHHVYHDEDYLEQPSSESEDEEERRSTNVKYLSNLQHIQNMMGDVSDAHDAILPLFKHLDWSDEAEAIMIVQGTMVAFVGMSLVMCPWGKVVVKEGVSLGKDVVAWGQVQAQDYKKNRK
ncbi:SET-binding factor 2 [Mortierella sp. GBA35]|nr:SET-binding factor 2 [Mortierella sp. GBA35]